MFQMSKQPTLNLHMLLWLKKRRIHGIVLIMGFISCLCSCGYHFADKSGGLPSDIKTVAIPFFVNKTFEPAIENFFTNALIDEFIRRGMVRLGGVDGSDAVIKGAVTSFSTSPISFDGNGRALEYRASVILKVSFIRNDNGAVLWEATELPGQHEYLVSSDTTMTYGNKRNAIKKVAEDLAEEIHNRIFEGF